MSIITTGQTSYPIAAGVGRLVDQPAAIDTFAALRSSVGATELWRITVSTATNPFTYTLRGRLPGNEWTECSFTTSATTDTALRNGLVSAWNANPILAGIATAANHSSGVAINFTAKTEGAAGSFEIEVVTDSNNALTDPSEITAGADAVETPFGRYVSVTAKNSYAHLSALAGPTITYTLTHDAAQTGSASIIAQDPAGNVFGFAVSGVATGADLPAFLAAWNAALVAELAGTGATVTTDSPDVVVAFPIGWSITTSDSSASGGTADVTNVVAAGDAAPISALCWDDRSQSPTSIGGTVTGYPAGTAANLLRQHARVAVENPGETIAYGDAVWVETAAGDDLGRPYVDPSPSRFRHPSHTWVELDGVSSLAIIGA